MRAREPRTGITALRNLGPVSARWLEEVGIRSEAQLRAVGSVGAFRMVAMAGYRPSLNLAYAMEAALRGVRWTELSAEERARIRRALDSPWDPRDLPDLSA